jgi:hypothetical protein
MNARPVRSPTGHHTVIGGAAPACVSPNDTDASGRVPAGRSAALVRPMKYETFRSRLITRTTPVGLGESSSSKM